MPGAKRVTVHPHAAARRIWRTSRRSGRPRTLGREGTGHRAGAGVCDARAMEARLCRRVCVRRRHLAHGAPRREVAAVGRAEARARRDRGASRLCKPRRLEDPMVGLHRHGAHAHAHRHQRRARGDALFAQGGAGGSGDRVLRVHVQPRVRVPHRVCALAPALSRRPDGRHRRAQRAHAQAVRLQVGGRHGRGVAHGARDAARGRSRESRGGCDRRRNRALGGDYDNVCIGAFVCARGGHA